MSYHPVSSIAVKAWGQRIGVLAPSPQQRFYAFEYDPVWRRGQIEFAPLTMPLAQARHLAAHLPVETYWRLPAAIADALPDAFGNRLVDAYLAHQGVDQRAITPLDRLAYQGKRGLGALEFEPMRGPSGLNPTALDLSALVTAARSVLTGQFGSSNQATAALRSLIRVGTSAGGARAKAVIGLNPSTGDVCAGQGDLAKPWEYWLIKLNGADGDSQLGPSQSYGRIEYAYSLMARAAGIDMTATRLLEEGGRAHFLTRRFDRLEDGTKLHLQSLCGLAELDFKAIGTHAYEQLLMTIDRLELGNAARTEVLRRCAFNVVAANCDDHTKNFAFLMTPQGQWSLAPAYDLTHAYSANSFWNAQHLMSVNGQFSEITWADLMAMADRFAIPYARQVIAEVNEALDLWPELAKRAGLETDLTKAVGNDFRRLTARG